jgi:HEAT repeat protein
MTRLRALAAALVIAFAAPQVPGIARAGFEWSGKMEAVAKRLKDPDAGVRMRAVEELKEYDIEDTKKHLIPMLKDSDENVKKAAARVLAVNKVEEAIPVVAEWLQALDRGTRMQAADLLGEIGSPKAVSALARALADTETEVRGACVNALGKIGGPTVVVPIVSRLDDDQVTVRRFAVQQLKEIGDPRAVIPLLERFNDTAKDVRVAAVQAIGKMGDQRAVPALLRLLRDGMPEVRIAAIEALGLLKATDATDELIPLLDQRTSDEMGAKVAEALGRIGEPRAVRELVKRLRTEQLRLAATEALKLVGSPAVPALLECLEGKIDDCDASPVVDLLKALGDKRATKALVAELSRTRVKKEKLIDALGAIRDPAALVPLLALMDDKSLEVRRRVLQVIEPMLDGRAGDVLTQALDDKDDEIRVRAAGYLGVLGIKTAVPRLLALTVEGVDPDLRLTAIRSLGRIGDPRATDTLVALLRDGKGAPQLEAADALANLKDPRSIPVLLELALDEGFGGRRSALTALRGPLRGKPTGKEVDRARGLLEKLAASDDHVLALDAVDALAALADKRSLPVLEKLAKDAPHDLRRVALETLGNYGDAKVTATLKAALADDDDGIRGAAAWSLGKLAARAESAALVKAARDRGFATPVNAVAALARLGKDAPLDDLLAMASHRNPYVRANAATALARVGGDQAKKQIVAMLGDSHRYARAAAARSAVKLGVAVDKVKELAEKDDDATVKAVAAEALAGGKEPVRDEWVHIWWTDSEGAPLKQELYVLVGSDGVIKAGYTDQRGEAGEEEFARGAWEYQCLGQPGPEAYTSLDSCRPAENEEQ